MTKISWNSHGVLVERRSRPRLVPADRRASGQRLGGTLSIRA